MRPGAETPKGQGLYLIGLHISGVKGMPGTHPISIHLLKEGGTVVKVSGGDPGSFGTGKVSCTFTMVAFGISSTTTTAVDGPIRREGEEKDTERRDQE